MATYAEHDNETTTRSDVWKLRDYCDRRFADLDAERSQAMALWREIGQEMAPIKLPFLVQLATKERAGQHNQHIVDPTAQLAADTTAAALVSGSMPAHSPWHEFRIRSDFEPADDAKAWAQKEVRKQRDILNGSNVNQIAVPYMREAFEFGTANAMLLQDDQDTIRLDMFSIGEYWIAEDSRDRVDTSYRKCWLTVGQLADEFGKEQLSRTTRRMYDRGQFDQLVECMHAIEPDRGNQRWLSGRFGWRSVYYELDSGKDEILAVRGFDKFPCLVTRWDKQPGTAYGLGRGVHALPHVRRLRKQVRAYALAIEKKLDPALQLPAGISQQEVRRLPGQMTTLKGAEKIQELVKTDIELQKMDEDMERMRQAIRDVLGASLVASLRTIRHQMTAHEADLRVQQDLMEYLPGIYRLHEEWHGPLIEGLFDAMMERGQVAPIPSSIADGSLDIEFTSPLWRKQREPEAEAIIQQFALAAEIGKVTPEAWDNIDVNLSFRRIAEIRGVPQDTLKPLEDVIKAQMARAQQQQAQALALAAQQSADVGATLSQAGAAA